MFLTTPKAELKLGPIRPKREMSVQEHSLKSSCARADTNALPPNLGTSNPRHEVTKVTAGAFPPLMNE